MQTIPNVKQIIYCRFRGGSETGEIGLKAPSLSSHLLSCILMLRPFSTRQRRPVIVVFVPNEYSAICKKDLSLILHGKIGYAENI